VRGTRPRKAQERNFCRSPPFFGSTNTISRFDECFRDGQYSSVSYVYAVFFIHGVPRAQPFVKVGTRASRVL